MSFLPNTADLQVKKSQRYSLANGRAISRRTKPWPMTFASARVSGHVLPTLTYRRAVDAFGESSAMELIYLVGLYCFVSVTLNGFDVPVPE
jgi:hypothetical protein